MAEANNNNSARVAKIKVATKMKIGTNNVGAQVRITRQASINPTVLQRLTKNGTTRAGSSCSMNNTWPQTKLKSKLAAINQNKDRTNQQVSQVAKPMKFQNPKCHKRRSPILHHHLKPHNLKQLRPKTNSVPQKSQTNKTQSIQILPCLNNSSRRGSVSRTITNR